jgi:hypothetical protein
MITRARAPRSAGAIHQPEGPCLSQETGVDPRRPGHEPVGAGRAPGRGSW